MSYLVHLVTFLEIYFLVAAGLTLIVGQCGSLNLAHSAFFSVGAYAAAIVSIGLGTDWLIAVIAAMLIAGLASCLLSLSAWRARGDSFVLITLALQSMFFAATNNWYSDEAGVGTLQNLTNGPFGIAGIPPPTLASFAIDDGLNISVFGAFLVAVTWLTLAKAQSSPWGRMVRACRDDEIAARSLGKRASKVRAVGIAVGCSLAAAGGALYAGYVRYVDPSIGALDQSILFLSMVILGGVQRLTGALAGASILLLLPELLRVFGISGQAAASGRNIVVGVSLCLIVFLRPQGLFGEYRLRS